MSKDAKFARGKGRCRYCNAQYGIYNGKKGKGFIRCKYTGEVTNALDRKCNCGLFKPLNDKTIRKNPYRFYYFHHLNPAAFPFLFDKEDVKKAKDQEEFINSFLRGEWRKKREESNDN